MVDPGFRTYRDRWMAVNKIEMQEQQSASIALRWQQLNSIYRLAKVLGLSPEKS